MLPPSKSLLKVRLPGGAPAKPAVALHTHMHANECMAWHGSLIKGRAGREITFSCIMFVTYIGQMCLVCVLISQLLSVHCPDGAY